MRDRGGGRLEGWHYSSMQIVQICPAFNVLSAGPLPGAEARFARALDEPLSLQNQSYSLLTFF